MSDKYICVLDFEANCAQNMKELNMDNEVIEFPSVLLKYKYDGNKQIEKISEFQMFCKPKNKPTLTPFCIELTKITQDKVNNGVSFPTALKEHEMWLRNNIPNFDEMYKENNVIIVTCGEWDMSVMAPKEYKNYGIKKVHPIYLKYVNIKIEFNNFYKIGSKFGMATMLEYLGLSLDGTHHSGIDDCKNISKIVIKLFDDGHEYDKMKVRYVKLDK